MTRESEKRTNFPARPDKTIDWLGTSRDDWKAKTQITKSKLKVAKQAQQRARRSREEWKKKCREIKRQQTIILVETSEEISNLKTKIQKLENENADLKKKYWLRQMTKN